MGKRGTKPKQVKRERNGRASRRKADVMAETLKALDTEQRETLGPALIARNRVLGVQPIHTKDQLAGTFIGRLCLQGMVSRAQYHAAQSWLDDCRRYALALGAPRSSPGAIDLNATRGRSIEFPEDEDRTRQAVEEYDAAIKVIQAAQNELRLGGSLYAALHYVVNMDLELYHLVGWLRLALNPLVKHYGWERLDQAA